MAAEARYYEGVAIEKDEDNTKQNSDTDEEEDEQEDMLIISTTTDAVEDERAPDPKLQAYLKSYRNTVPVPSHWSQKEENYLQGKGGIKKQPFQLPDYIAATGIEKIREGKMDVDYQVFRDAFFVYQTKPKLTSYGDIQCECECECECEGEELEVNLKEPKPGKPCQELEQDLA